MGVISRNKEKGREIDREKEMEKERERKEREREIMLNYTGNDDIHTCHGI